MTGGAEPLIRAAQVTAGYGDLAAIRDIDLEVRPGEVVALFGANGAGKSTTLLALSGVLPLASGEVYWRGRSSRRAPHQMAREGLAFVPEGKSVLVGMTVRDNLLLGKGGLEFALAIFPELEPLLGRRAGLISGGEQQMLVLARALAADPDLIMVDELSQGLAPIVVDRLMRALRRAVAERGVGVLLVEQEARRGLDIADRWYLLRTGKIVGTGDATTGTGLLETEYLAGVPRRAQPIGQ